MRLADISRIALAAALTACAIQPESLNSDLIRERFGSYGVEVLEQSDHTRRSNLYSLEATGRVCRTYAVVQFGEATNAEISATHEAVMAGQSLGATFRDAGWEIEKRTIHIGSVAIDNDDHHILELMHLAGTRNLAIHVYDMYLERGSDLLHYATVLELHHPEYQSEADLRARYGGTAGGVATRAQIDSIEALVQSD